LNGSIRRQILLQILDGISGGVETPARKHNDPAEQQNDH
jgi:hypothetical protein